MIENDEIGKDGEPDCVICYKDLCEDQFSYRCHFFSTPCYVFLFPREKFQTVQFKDKVFSEIFIAPEKVKPIAKFICDSFFDP
jgi:hypothetical protein